MTKETINKIATGTFVLFILSVPFITYYAMTEHKTRTKQVAVIETNEATITIERK
jgi:hypothetical protein